MFAAGASFSLWADAGDALQDTQGKGGIWHAFKLKPKSLFGRPVWGSILSQQREESLLGVVSLLREEGVRLRL
jgi:hypothetical protein